MGKQATIGDVVADAEKTQSPPEPAAAAPPPGNGSPTPPPEAPAGAVPMVTQKAPWLVTERGLQLTDLNSLWRFSQIALASGLAPASFKSVEAIAIAVQMGLELGMSPMMALQNMAVINGRPGPYGAIVKGMVEKSGLLEDYQENYEGVFPEDAFKAVVVSVRRGRPTPLKTEFSIADAKAAGLWGKAGPWTTYPKRMLLWRARQFNYNDNFADVTKGFRTAEELVEIPIDAEVVESTPLEQPRRASEAPPATS